MVKGKENEMRTECAVNFESISNHLEFIKNAVSGDDGISKKIIDHETYIQQAKGRNKVILGAVGGGWALTILSMIITITFMVMSQ